MALSAKNDLQCLKCHTIQGEGGKIGPDLSAIGTKASRENLLESLINPSKAVADQFITWVVATKKGQTISGLLVEETPDSVTLRDANGKDSKIPKSEIEERTKSPQSLMPANAVSFMTEEELIDLVEYMLSLKQETTTGRPNK
jgi:putative heme-binding domain-containing protein